MEMWNGTQYARPNNEGTQYSMPKWGGTQYARGGVTLIQCRVWSELNALKRRVNNFDDLQQSHKIPNAVSRKNL